MKRNKFMRGILVAGSALILIGVALMLWMLLTAEERTVLHVDLDAAPPLKFEELCLIPGEEVAYTLELNANKADAYDVTFDFVETEERTLKNYARVRIEAGEEVLYDELMATAFEDTNIKIPVDFDEEKNTELTIVYYLPIDVGNEAENAQAVFELLITASNK